jgi:phosphate starvation-inducible protein PhoH and related proteins
MKKPKTLLAEPRTKNQERLIDAIASNNFVIASGPAGTGKTFVAVSCLAALFAGSSDYKRIVLARPNVPTGPSLGSFPGTSEEKLASWLQPLLSNFRECFGKGYVDSLIKSETMVLQPVETIRGQSYEDCLVIVDEAQNLTKNELIAVATRLGEGSKLVLTGDPWQTDMRDGGFEWLSRFVERNQLPSSKVIKFEIEDIVRSGFVGAFVKALSIETKKE